MLKSLSRRKRKLMSKIAQNYKKIKKELGKTELVVVTKTRSVDDIRELYALGQRHFGENRVQELKQKAEDLKDLKEIRFHMIGQLQRNKIKALVSIPSLYAIHSVGSLKIIEELNKYDHRLNIFFQINTSGEEEKGGFETLQEIREAGYLMEAPVYGLMTMGKIRTENFEEDAKKCFEKLQNFKMHLDPILKLSMGMSQDYKIALKVGTDYARIGSKIFETIK